MTLGVQGRRVARITAINNYRFMFHGKRAKSLRWESRFFVQRTLRNISSTTKNGGMVPYFMRTVTF